MFTEQAVSYTATLFDLSGKEYAAFTAKATLPKNGSAKIGELLGKELPHGTLFLLRLAAFEQDGNPLATNEYLFVTGDHFAPILALPAPTLALTRKGEALTLKNNGTVAALY